MLQIELAASLQPDRRSGTEMSGHAVTHVLRESHSEENPNQQKPNGNNAKKRDSALPGHRGQGEEPHTV